MKKTTLLLLMFLVGQVLYLPLVSKTMAIRDFDDFVYSVGTNFEITNSPYLNITLTSTEVVRVLLQTGPRMVSLIIESNCSATSTSLTFDGFEANKNHCKFQDGYLIANFTTDSSGKHIYTQDILEAHHITIQEGRSTIYIRPDGTINPVTAPISIVGNTYTFTDNIYESIFVQKDNIILDGNGYTLQGPEALQGIYLGGRSNVTVKNVVAKGWWEAITLWNTHACEIRDNDVSDNTDIGILLFNSDSNNITENAISRNENGIALVWKSNLNMFTGNDISDQTFAGVRPLYAGVNQFYHNNFVNNRFHVYTWAVDLNVWDDGYPSGGNCWSGHTDTDSCSGPNQNEIGSDGICDTPCVIDVNNIDHYPLKNPWVPVETSVPVGPKDYPVTIVSDTTIDHIVTTKNTLHFESSGSTGEEAYIKLVFPMVNTTKIIVFIDGTKLTPPPFPVIGTDGINYFVYFEFTLSTHTVAIQFAPITAAIDLDPDRLNLKSNGEFITAYIELPEGYDVADIDLSTVQLSGISAITDEQYGFVTDPDSYLADHDGDGVVERMVKFDRATVRDSLTGTVDYVEGTKFYDLSLPVTGELLDGTSFEGSDTIVVISK